MESFTIKKQKTMKLQTMYNELYALVKEKGAEYSPHIHAEATPYGNSLRVTIFKHNRIAATFEAKSYESLRGMVADFIRGGNVGEETEI